MLTVKLNNVKARQLEETLFAAGFTAQEVLVSWSEDSGSSKALPNARSEHSSDLMCYLKVQTQTAMDVDVAKAVLRDCGLQIIETKPLLGVFVPMRKVLGDNALKK